MKRGWVVAAVAIALLSPGFVRAGEPMNALVLMKSGNFGSFMSTISRMKAMGVEVRVAIPPQAAMVYLRQEVSDRLKNAMDDLGILSVDRESIPAKRINKLGGDAVQIAGAWNAILEKRRLVGQGRLGRPTPRMLPDAFAAPPADISWSRTIPVHSPPWDAKWYDTSEYMLGNPAKVINVMVSLILPESSGSAEDWQVTGTVFTDGWTVFGEVANGLDFWASSTPACAPLTFGLTPPQMAPTTWEPITLRGQGPFGPCGGEEDKWINQVMASICPGCAGPTYFDKVRQYDDWLRLAVDSDWAYTIFVANSKNDPDNSFAPLPAGPPCNNAALFAYAYVGGPFVVMTWGSDGYGTTWMDAVTAHESGHIFYALDEYCSASSPAETSGYLNVANGNHQLAFPGVCPTDYSCSAWPAPPATGVCCIMRGQVESFVTGGLCDYTRGQIGWRDADGNSVMDIVDTLPNAVFTFSDPSVIDASRRPALIRQAARIVGVATCGTLYNANPYGAHHNITVSGVVDVQYRVDLGPWLQASPGLPPFGSSQEPFYFDVGVFAPGTIHTLDVFAGCNAGCMGATVYCGTVSASVYTVPLPATCP